MPARLHGSIITGSRINGATVYDNPPQPLITNLSIKLDGAAGALATSQLPDASIVSTLTGEQFTQAELKARIVALSKHLRPLSATDFLAAMEAENLDSVITAWSSGTAYFSASQFTSAGALVKDVSGADTTKSLLTAGGISANPVQGTVTLDYSVQTKTTTSTLKAGSTLLAAYTKAGGK